MTTQEFSEFMLKAINENVENYHWDALLDVKYGVDLVINGEDFSFYWLVRPTGTWISTNISDFLYKLGIITHTAVYIIDYRDKQFSVVATDITKHNNEL